jgi:hypothetical protein
VPIGEHAQAAEQGALLVARREHQGGLAGDGAVEGDRLARHDDHARVVLRLVLDAALQDREAVQPRCLVARDRGLGEVLLVADSPRGHRGVGERLHVAVAQAAEEAAALAERHRVRVDAPDARERHLLERQQAVIHFLDLLADERQVHPREQIVGRRHRARRRVLDGEHRVVEVAPVDALEHLLEGVEPGVRDVGAPRTEMAPGRELAVRPLGALVAYADGAQARRVLWPERHFLGPHRLPHDLPEQPRHEERVEPRVARTRDDLGQHVLLAAHVAQRSVAARLRSRHLAHEPLPLGQDFHERRVHLVQPLPNLVQLHVGLLLLGSRGPPCPHVRQKSKRPVPVVPERAFKVARLSTAAGLDESPSRSIGAAKGERDGPAAAACHEGILSRETAPVKQPRYLGVNDSAIAGSHRESTMGTRLVASSVT